MEGKLTETGLKVEVKPLSSGQGLREKTYKNGRLQQYTAAIIVSMMAFIFGTVVGWPAPIQTILESSDSPVGLMTPNQTAWLGSLTFLGGLFGTLFWGRFADRFGRKMAGYAVAIPYIVGWSIIFTTSNHTMIFLARFCTGISGTGSLILCPLYTGEIAQDAIRGTLGSYVVLFMNGGIVSAYTFGTILSYRLFAAFCLMVPLAFLTLYFWLPETPAYLWSKGKTEKAKKSLLWLRGGDQKPIQEEILRLKNTPKNKIATYSTLVETKGNRKAMIIGLGLFTWQQFCGILALLTYTTRIFKESGSSLSPNKATIMVGTFQLVASYLSSIIVDRSGRKVLLILSYLFMGLSLTTLAIYFYLMEININVNDVRWLPVVCLCLHVVTYALGAGPVPFVVMSETLAPHIRGLATSVIIFWGTALAYVSVQIFPLLVQNFGIYGNFVFFAAFCYAGLVFTLFIVPETKDIPLQDILLKLNGE